MINKKINPQEIKDDILKAYPAKVARKRAKHMVLNDPNPGNHAAGGGQRSNDSRYHYPAWLHICRM